jgi:hypothetical protein
MAFHDDCSVHANSQILQRAAPALLSAEKCGSVVRRAWYLTITYHARLTYTACEVDCCGALNSWFRAEARQRRIPALLTDHQATRLRTANEIPARPHTSRLSTAPHRCESRDAAIDDEKAFLATLRRRHHLRLASSVPPGSASLRLPLLKDCLIRSTSRPDEIPANPLACSYLVAVSAAFALCDFR